MNVSLLIARRYLFGKKKIQAINMITGIAITGIAIGTAALILIMSVFNGFESLMKSYLDQFNPDVKIVPSSGKFFALDSLPLSLVLNINEIEQYSVVLEEVALFEYRDKQQIGILKGVDDRYVEATSIRDAISEGKIRFADSDPSDYAVVGKGIYNNLDISLDNPFTPLKIYMPNRNKRGPLDREFTSRSLLVSGIFNIQNERDNQYVLCNYNLVSEILEQKGYASAIELKTSGGTQNERLFNEIGKIIGPNFEVQSRYQQDESFLKIMNIEKWSSYLIFGFTLLLIIFNVVGSLWMIVIDKKKDISILQSLGINKFTVKKIFITQGVFISLIGFIGGWVVALVFYYLQNSIGIISVPEGFSISSYPMQMRWSDILVVFITVIGLGIMASIPASNRATRVSAYVRVE